MRGPPSLRHCLGYYDADEVARRRDRGRETSNFAHGGKEQAEAAADELSVSRAAPAADVSASAAAGERYPYVVPSWLRQFGLASWLIIGLVIVTLAVLSLVGALLTLFVPTLFAALLGATFMPIADWLERRGMKRWLAALLVMLLIVLIAVAITLIVVVGVVREFPDVVQNLDQAAADISSWLKSHDVQISTQDIRSWVQQVGPTVIQGALATLVGGINGVATLIFGTFIGLNILAYFLADGRGLGRWASRHLSPIPQPVAYHIIANAARFLRGYIWGSTIIGLFNGAVMLVGALVLGVPLAATIGIVGWFTNYIPTFGAIIGGAFAVLIALASGGLTKAILMLLVVLIANSPLQTVVSPVRPGRRAQAAPAGGAVRHHGGHHPVRGARRDRGGAVPQDRPRHAAASSRRPVCSTRRGPARTGIGLSPRPGCPRTPGRRARRRRAERPPADAVRSALRSPPRPSLRGSAEVLAGTP